MLFNSIEFLIFLPIVLVIYYALKTRSQNIFLVAASYFFYGWWDWRFCGLLAFSTVLDYFCALGMADSQNERRRRLCIWLSILGNLGVLGFFKYYNFFLSSLVELLTQLGLNANVPFLRVILPVGISFYTFQTLSYTIDVYRRKFEPTRDFLALAAYVSFFPQLVAGPIERAKTLLPQMLKPRTIEYKMVSTGAFLILLGFFKKVAIADAIAGEVDSIFSAASESSWSVLLRGVWLFAIQIYCDFSGYSDIARGIARLLGFELMVNFNQPYLSPNITVFWQRWHISLSTWLRDYLYIPLGGNRQSIRKTYRNLMLTMILGGLWHGANWTFVVWGTLHGCYLAVHKWMLKGRKAMASPASPDFGSRVVFLVKILLTFHLVLLTYVFFRAESLTLAIDYVGGILTFRGSWGDETLNYLRLLFFVALVLFVDLPQHRSGRHERMLEWSWGIRGVVFWMMIFLMIVLAPGEETPFVYFQF